jgi:predicted site-specific integrase-resolvase
MMTQQKKALTKEQAAGLLGVTVNTLQKWINEGYGDLRIRTQAAMVGGKPRVVLNPDDIDAIRIARGDGSVDDVKWGDD